MRVTRVRVVAISHGISPDPIRPHSAAHPVKKLHPPLGRVIEADQPRASLEHHAASANEEFANHIPSQSTNLALKLILLYRLIAACLLTQKMKTAWMATLILIVTIATTTAVHADDYSLAIKTHRGRVEMHAVPSGAAAAAHASELDMPQLSW